MSNATYKEKLIALAESLEIREVYDFIELPIEDIKQVGEEMTKSTKLLVEAAEYYMEVKGFSK
jgi:hypothetical protein